MVLKGVALNHLTQSIPLIINLKSQTKFDHHFEKSCSKATKSPDLIRNHNQIIILPENTRKMSSMYFKQNIHPSTSD